MLRKGDASVKEAAVTDATPDSEVIKLMVKNPNAIQRPILEVDDRAVLARPIDKALELLQ